MHVVRIAAMAALLVLDSPGVATAADVAPCCADPARFWQTCTVLPPTTPDSIRLRIGGAEETLPLGSIPLKNAAAALRRPGDALVALAGPPDARVLEALGADVCWSTRVGGVT